MPRPPERILITGANGHLGRQLIQQLCGGRDALGGSHVRALVRSERAAEQVRGVPVERAPEIVIGDYTDAASMAEAVSGCDAVVHLVGIIKEGAGATYEAAHEQTCTVLAHATSAADVQRIVYLSIVGAQPDSANACLASKGRAEQVLLDSGAPTTVIRVPMVLGPDDFASAALRGQAQSRLVVLIGGGSTMQQPIDSADVVAAVRSALETGSDRSQSFDLGGPERLTHRALVAHAAGLYGKSPVIVPIPIGLVRCMAAAFEKLLANPPITIAMLEVLQHDDRIDEAKSCEQLGVRLTPLDETLRRYVGPGSAHENEGDEVD